MNKRDNILRAIRFERPDYIPMSFQINAACWQNYPQEALFDLMESHKFLFPDFVRHKGKYIPSFHTHARKNEIYTDEWSCVWQSPMDGITGVVTKHPLTDWGAFNEYKFPDPNKNTGNGPVDWENMKASIAKDREAGYLTIGGLRHGHTFLQLCDIRGYENAIYDMFDDEPKLLKFMAKLEEFNLYIVNKYLDAGVDMIVYPEDLGMQTGPMISPEYFKKYIKPSYQRLMMPARKNGAIIHMHSDGDLHDLIDDIIEGGVQVINLQDLVNGIDWIAGRFGGKVCVELDIDRQNITVNGTSAQIDSMIRKEVEKISSKQGGLMMVYGLYPGTPIENAVAVADAMEKYAFYY